MLTDEVIRGLKPRGKQYKVSDQGGLYLLVKPNGSKLWRFKYYIEGIEKAPLAFGVYPEITLKRAREKQGEARKLLDQRIDPAVERREAKEAAQRAYTAAKIDTFSSAVLQQVRLQVLCPTDVPPRNQRVAQHSFAIAPAVSWVVSCLFGAEIYQLDHKNLS